MQSSQIKRLAINVMIAGLIGSAGVAVVAVLVGQFNDVLTKALFTLLIVALHALVSLGFLESRTKGHSSEDLKVFTNTIFVLIVFSFITAVFGIWGLLPGELIWKLYATYFIAAFASLHGEMLYKTRGLDATITNITYANYIFMALVVILLLPPLWVSDSDFPDFYYRLLAATAIVDATLTILAVILHKLYLQKHPEMKSQLFTQIVYTVDANGNRVAHTVEPAKRRIHPLLVILGLFLLLQFVVPILFLVAGFFR